MHNAHNFILTMGIGNSVCLLNCCRGKRKYLMRLIKEEAHPYEGEEVESNVFIKLNYR